MYFKLVNEVLVAFVIFFNTLHDDFFSNYLYFFNYWVLSCNNFIPFLVIFYSST